MKTEVSIPVVLAEDLFLTAQMYRTSRGIAPSPGYILFWNYQPTGWILTLDKASIFRARVLAVSADSEIFTATGDDGSGGASAWVKIFPAVAQSETKRGSPDQEGAPGQPTKTGEPA